MSEGFFYGGLAVWLKFTGWKGVKCNFVKIIFAL